MHWQQLLNAAVVAAAEPGEPLHITSGRTCWYFAVYRKTAVLLSESEAEAILSSVSHVDFLALSWSVPLLTQSYGKLWPVHDAYLP